MTIEQLQKRILTAHERGDTRELARLQAQYRTQAVMSSAGRGYRLAPVRVTDRPAGAIFRAANRPTVPAPWPRVSLYEGVLRELRRHELTGSERAGWLVGSPQPEAGELSVKDAVGLASDEDSFATEVGLELSQARLIERSLPDDEVVCGDWHSHPWGDGSPSKQDLLAWERTMTSLHRSHWVGLIVRESQHPHYGDVRLSAVLLRRDKDRVTHRSVQVSTWSYR